MTEQPYWGLSSREALRMSLMGFRVYYCMLDLAAGSDWHC
jgi:hypothetical protein